MANKYNFSPLVACNNEDCYEHKNCLRFEAWTVKAIEKVKRFNGSEEKGCGKFIASK